MANDLKLPGGQHNRKRVLLALDIWEKCGLAARTIFNRRAPNVLYAQTAQRLLFMCAAHESGGFRLRRQRGVPEGVGAYGIMQVELDTAEYVIEWAANRPALLRRINEMLLLRIEGLTRGNLLDILQTPEGDLLGCVLARLKFLTDRDPIPWSPILQSKYAKKVYNTSAGKATAKKYLEAYVLWFQAVMDSRAVLASAADSREDG